MAKQHCPNCDSTDYHTSWSHPDPRCNYCGYSAEFPDRKPPIPQPMRRVDPTSPEHIAERKAKVEADGYYCCGSKVFDRHTRDCPYYGHKRSETWGT